MNSQAINHNWTAGITAVYRIGQLHEISVNNVFNAFRLTAQNTNLLTVPHSHDDAYPKAPIKTFSAQHTGSYRRVISTLPYSAKYTPSICPGQLPPRRHKTPMCAHLKAQQLFRIRNGRSPVAASRVPAESIIRKKHTGFRLLRKCSATKTSKWAKYLCVLNRAIILTSV